MSEASKLPRHKGKGTMKTHEIVPSFSAPLKKRGCKGLVNKRTKCMSRVSQR